MNEQYIEIFKALSDDTRLAILQMLSKGEMCACNIQSFFAITQPTLSYHMKILTDSGLVSCSKVGARAIYKLNKDKLNAIKNFFAHIIEEQIIA